MEREAKAERKGRSAAEVCTSESTEYRGNPLQRAIGAEPLSVLSTSVTKQTGDMVYTMAENSWLSQLWLGA